MRRKLPNCRVCRAFAALVLILVGCGKDQDGAGTVEPRGTPGLEPGGAARPEDDGGIRATVDGSTDAAGTPTTIKVVTWNVMDGGFRDAGQAFLVARRPQIAFLQEVDSKSLVDEVVAKLTADQGGPWYSETICRGTDSCASNVTIVSKYPLTNVGQVDLRAAGTYVIACAGRSDRMAGTACPRRHRRHRRTRGERLLRAYELGRRLGLRARAGDRDSKDVGELELSVAAHLRR
jgi:hypothetical protein